jgi:hypothetical protein
MLYFCSVASMARCLGFESNIYRPHSLMSIFATMTSFSHFNTMEFMTCICIDLINIRQSCTVFQ